jgi:hypothetical protein
MHLILSIPDTMVLDHEIMLFLSLLNYFLLPKARIRSPQLYKLLTQGFYTILCLDSLVN